MSKNLLDGNGAEQIPGALLDVGQAAERLGVTPRFVRRLVFERRLAYIKVGKYVRFELADLEAWLASRRVEALGRS
ncbi:MAG: helix-turn-helix domain-containing protein [Acidimicrobiales bacterium]